MSNKIFNLPFTQFKKNKIIDTEPEWSVFKVSENSSVNNVDTSSAPIDNIDLIIQVNDNEPIEIKTKMILNLGTLVKDDIVKIKGTASRFTVSPNLVPIGPLANHGLTAVLYMFRKNTMTEIPNDLFRYNTEIFSFEFCFLECFNLINIPSNIFKYNITGSVFSGTFTACEGIISVPENMFDTNINIQRVGSCFSGCENITSSVPDLWNTTKWPNITEYYYCFEDCINISNYSDIPNDWK